MARKIILLLALASRLCAVDSELTNYKSGIDVTWGGIKGTDYCEEYFYHDKLLDDHKVVYLKAGTTIAMSHNALNSAYPNNKAIIGVNGADGIADSGDEGVIRYKIDRDRQWDKLWSMDNSGTNATKLNPAYAAPFTLASQTYDGLTDVVGTTGGNGGLITSKSAYYFRGILDSFGDEWHVLAYADDDRQYSHTQLGLDAAFTSSDGKTVLLVVNPKTPCFTARATGTGQFYTTKPKAYWTPKICAQTTYLSPGSSGAVAIELRDINGNNVFYRINGGSFTDAGSSVASLTDANFSTGSNTLEYYYAGNVAYTKTRLVVKNPTFPSAAEAHGYKLLIDSGNYSTVLSRITRAPYLSTYNGYKTNSGTAGQDAWDAVAGQGKRVAFLNGGHYTVRNAFVALVNGYTYKITGKTKSSGEYAKGMLLESTRTIDPMGYEMQHSSESIPNRELHYRGYYDAKPVMDGAFAYDIMIANFRSDQVSGGITPVEDYFIRDQLASFAFEGMMATGGFTGVADPGMWGGARIMTAAIIGAIMPEYSTPYFGTSGFGTVQTTYPLCPYQDDQLTWKAACVDDTKAKTSYPNFRSGNGISGNDNTAQSLFNPAGKIISGFTLPEGSWIDKTAYLSTGLMGVQMEVFANMNYLYASGALNARYEKGINFISNGNMLGAKIASGLFLDQAVEYQPMLLLQNSRFPTVWANSHSRVVAAASADPASDDATMTDYDVYGFAWYDDSAGPSGTAPSAPSSMTATVNSTSQVTLDWVDTARDENGYVVEKSTNNTSWTSVGTLASMLPGATSQAVKQLAANTLYYFRVRAVNEFGESANVTAQTTTTVGAADVTAPTPNPATFSGTPTTTTTTISVTSSLAVDETSLGGTPYSFSIDGGDTWSVFQTSRTMIFTGLSPSTSYSISVKFRDAALNETAESTPIAVVTNAVVISGPVIITAPTVTATKIILP